jgi:hypothetical protein
LSQHPGVHFDPEGQSEFFLHVGNEGQSSSIQPRHRVLPPTSGVQTHVLCLQNAGFCPQVKLPRHLGFLVAAETETVERTGAVQATAPAMPIFRMTSLREMPLPAMDPRTVPRGLPPREERS